MRDFTAELVLTHRLHLMVLMAAFVQSVAIVLSARLPLYHVILAIMYLLKDLSLSLTVFPVSLVSTVPGLRVRLPQMTVSQATTVREELLQETSSSPPKVTTLWPELGHLHLVPGKHIRKSGSANSSVDLIMTAIIINYKINNCHYSMLCVIILNLNLCNYLIMEKVIAVLQMFAVKLYNY